MEFRTTMSENGRLVIPVACRQALHLAPGEELIIRIEDEELHLFSLKHSIKKAQALIKQHAKGKSLIKQLKRMRQEENDE